MEEIDKNKYFVPVTSYINDDEEKVKIIIENLSSKYIYEPNLISLLNSNTELLNYEINCARLSNLLFALLLVILDVHFQIVIFLLHLLFVNMDLII